MLPNPTNNQEILEDYGFILKIHPEQHKNKVWIVCAGYGEWGTSGAAYYLAKNWKYIYKKAKDKPFAIMINVEIGKDESAKIESGIFSIWKDYERDYVM